MSVDSQGFAVAINSAGTVNRPADGQRIYCPSLSPRSDNGRARRCQQFSADDITGFGEPLRLARALGSIFGQVTPVAPVSFDSELYAYKPPFLREHSPFKCMVHVLHGSVAYSDRPEELIEPVPPHPQPTVVPFAKPSDFAHQREYRFTISTIGSPADDVLFVPVTEEPRAFGMDEQRWTDSEGSG